jgi:hypothetical protein
LTEFCDKLVVHFQLALDKPKFAMGEVIFDICRVVMELAQNFECLCVLAFGY